MLFANDNKSNIKQTLNSNMTLNYLKKPKNIHQLENFLSDGLFYGRIRLNNFIYDAKSVGEDHYIGAVGGSLIYKSAVLNGFSFTSGLYTSQNLGDTNRELAPLYKGGKDVLNRYDVATKNKYGLTSLAQLYGEYKNDKSQIRVGHFPLETLLLKSNDTKMIPNTFEGVHFTSKSISNSTLQVAYISKQKLRDKTSFHHVLAYGDNPQDPYSKWTQNDDSGMHRGLTLSKLQEKNIDDKIFLIEMKNKSIENSTLKASYTAVPKLISSLILEAQYQIDNESFTITPSLRYMQQFDDGAGEMAGSNLRNNTVAYKNPQSLSASLIAGRIDMTYDNTKIRLGYSKIADDGDIIAPWRGFPTAGYTRAMGQTNWYANTESYMIRADYDLSNVGIDNLKTMMRYSINDFDDNKAGVQADNSVLTIDFIKGFEGIPNLSTKLRTAFVQSNDDTLAQDGSIKSDASYNEVRIELNYLF
jgi:hypothetical protein